MQMKPITLFESVIQRNGVSMLVSGIIYATWQSSNALYLIRLQRNDSNIRKLLYWTSTANLHFNLMAFYK